MRFPCANTPPAIAAGLLLFLGVAGAAPDTNPPPSAATPPRRLGLAESVQAALLNNRLLQIERLNPMVARSTLDASRGYYDPILTVGGRRESLTDSGGLDPADFSRDAIYNAQSKVADIGLMGFLPSGLSYTVGGHGANSYGVRNALDFDAYNLNVGVTVQQPLLRNFWIDQARMQIRVNRKALRITELGVEYFTADTLNQTQLAYYELGFAWGNCGVLERLCKARRDLLEGIRRQVQVGLLTALDEHAARAQLAAAEERLVAATSARLLAENLLLNLIGDPFTNQAHQAIEPADALLVLPVAPLRAESVQSGLKRRADLLQLREDVSRADIDLKFRRNQLFPSLNVVAGYTRRGASTYQALDPNDNLDPMTGELLPTPPPASLSDAFEQIRRGDNPSDMIGLIFSMPLTLTTERANYRASRHLKAQAQLRVKQREEQILREINDALDNIQTGLGRVEAARRATRFAREALQAEEKKLAGGLSTVIFVLQMQTSLAMAETTEWRALADYNKAVSQLRFAEGSLLDQYRVTLKYE